MEAYPPLNRPSVRHATSYPSPAPIIRLVGFSISGMPDQVCVRMRIKRNRKKPAPDLTEFRVQLRMGEGGKCLPGPPFGPK